MGRARAVTGILQRVSWAAAIAVLATGLLAWVIGLRIYVVQLLFCMAALPLAIVAAATLAATLLRRHGPPSSRRRTALALGLPVLVLASIPLGRSLAFARTRTEAGDGRTVKLVTYNVLFQGGNPAASLGLVRRSAQADVLAFQEVTPAWLQRLTATLGGTHPHRAARAVPGTHGLAVFSRFALGEPVYLPNRAGRAVAQCLPVFAPSAPFLLCNAHLASPAAALSQPSALTAGLRSNAEVRTVQWHELMDLVGRRFPDMRHRVVVAGDLNTLDSEPLYAEMRRDLVDAFRETRWQRGATFPNSVDLAPVPVVRIDYVLLSPAIRPVRAEVLPPSGSDHLAVRATLRVPTLLPP